MYCSLELPKFIQQTAEYKSKDYKQALTSGFLKFDASLTKPKAQEKLRSLWDYNKTKYSQDKDKDKKSKFMIYNLTLPVYHFQIRNVEIVI